MQQQILHCVHKKSKIKTTNAKNNCIVRIKIINKFNTPKFIGVM